MKLDICLQTDIFNTFSNTIWDKFEIYCSKYISLDLMLKYTKAKIEFTSFQRSFYLSSIQHVH